MPFVENKTPRWLDYSGLPMKLNTEISPFAWMVFKRLMELDCLANIEPDVFNESIEKLSLTLGLQPEDIRATLISLMKQEYIECYLPDTDQEPAFYKIHTPISTPISPLYIPNEEGGLQGSLEPIRLRYYSIPQPNTDENKFKQILHLYFDLCGLKLNSMIMDDLKEIERQFDIGKIKMAFQKAKRNKARSLRPVFGILYGKETGEKKRKKSIGEPVNQD